MPFAFLFARMPLILLLTIAGILAGCADVAVTPVAATTGSIRTVYILRNPTSDQNAPELESVIKGALQRHGIGTRLVDTLPLGDNDYCLTYVATEGWDLKSFMKNAEIRLKKGAKQVGFVSYVSGGGLESVMHLRWGKLAA